MTAWLEAAAHIIFSLQLGLGVLTTYGGYNKFGHSLVRDSCIIIFGHFCWVILSVLLVFSLRGVADNAARGVEADPEEDTRGARTGTAGAD